VARVLRRILLRLIGQIAGRRHQAGPVRRVLVIKPDHLGDVLLLTPALRLLRAALPEAHISLMLGPWSAAAVRGNPDVDALLFCPFPGFTRRPKPGLLQPYRLLLRMALLLRAGSYDVALIARDDHWWGALLALLAGIPRRIGHATLENAPLLTEALPYDPGAHVTIQSLDLVARLTGSDNPCAMEAPTMHAPITPEDEHWAATWIAAHGVKRDRLVAIHPGAGGLAKLWVAARWAMIADVLSAKGHRVLLTGGPGERKLIDEIQRRLAAPPLVLAGEATLGQLAALYRCCVLVLGVDSGPMHLATAAGTRTVALFGPVDHRRFAPWGPPDRHTVVRSDLWCSPCRVIEACPRGTRPSECMTTISLEQVLAAAEQSTKATNT
jgi:lipopolysaccharide heptosyltransferase II